MEPSTRPPQLSTVCVTQWLVRSCANVKDSGKRVLSIGRMIQLKKCLPLLHFLHYKFVLSVSHCFAVVGHKTFLMCYGYRQKYISLNV